MAPAVSGTDTATPSVATERNAIATTTTTAYAISLDSIRHAAKRLDGVAHRTPVLTCSALDVVASANGDGVQVRLFFKCENLQKIGAFKFRGATNAVRHEIERRGGVAATPDGEPLTFVTHSGGNHAQAVAFAARDAGCKAIIIMPSNAPRVKQDAVRGYGGQVELSEPTSEAQKALAAEWVARTGGVFIHPSDAPDVMSGQATATLELIEQVKHQFGVQLDAVAVPVGGGGLCSGSAMLVKSTNPSVKVFGVEPEGAANAHACFTSKTLQGYLTPPNTVADGLRATLGPNTFPVVRDLVDDILLVSDDEIVATMKLMWERMKLVVEPSGATAAACAVAHKLPLREIAHSKAVVNIGVVISGGNVDLDALPWVK